MEQVKLSNALSELIHRNISQRLHIDDNRYITIDKDINSDINCVIYNRNTDKPLTKMLYKKSLGYDEIAVRIWGMING